VLRHRGTDRGDHRLRRVFLRARAQHGSNVAHGQYLVDPPAPSPWTTAQGIL
jgi:hypothetical protein